MDWISLALPLVVSVWEHARPVEFAQGLLQAGIIWHLVKKSMQKELAQIRQTITDGFAAGEKRFSGIDHRLDSHDSRFEKLETKTNQ